MLIYTAIHADIYSNQLWTLFGYSTYSSNNIVYCNTLLWLYICIITWQNVIGLGTNHDNRKLLTTISISLTAVDFQITGTMINIRCCSAEVSHLLYQTPINPPTWPIGPSLPRGTRYCFVDVSIYFEPSHDAC